MEEFTENSTATFSAKLLDWNKPTVKSYKMILVTHPTTSWYTKTNTGKDYNVSSCSLFSRYGNIGKNAWFFSKM